MIEFYPTLEQHTYLAKAHATASEAADAFREAICAWAGLSERPSDAELIALLRSKA
jgi:hypothetical protein